MCGAEEVPAVGEWVRDGRDQLRRVEPELWQLAREEVDRHQGNQAVCDRGKPGRKVRRTADCRVLGTLAEDVPDDRDVGCCHKSDGGDEAEVVDGVRIAGEM